MNIIDDKLNDEKIISILRTKKSIYWLFILIVIYLYIFFIVGVISPVIMTGDYSAVWPSSDKRIVAKIILFYSGIYAIFIFPSLLPLIRSGYFLLYEDRVEVLSFLFKKKNIIFFNEMIVTVHGNYRLVLYRCGLGCSNSKVSRLVARYTNGVSFGLLGKGIANPSELPFFVNILEKKAAIFERKILS